MLTFLKKLGQILTTGIEIAGGFEPLIASKYPGIDAPFQTVSKDLAQVAQIIAYVEAMGQVSNLAGPDKLKAAAPLVAQVIISSSILAGKEIGNQTLFLEGCTDVTNGMAKVLNSIKADSLQTIKPQDNKL